MRPSLEELRLDAVNRMGDVIAEAEAGLTNGTPCGDWNVREVIEHTIGLNFGFARVLAVGTAPEEAFRPRPMGRWRDSVAAIGSAAGSQEGPVTEFRVAPVSLERAFSRRDVEAMHLLDVMVHAWDVASGLGRRFEPPEAALVVLAETAAVISTAPLPSTSEQFAPPLALAADEPAWPQVLRLVGRDPHWTPGEVRRRR